MNEPTPGGEPEQHAGEAAAGTGDRHAGQGPDGDGTRAARPDVAPDADPEAADRDPSDQELPADQERENAPRPLGLHVRPTGHPPVDARLGRLADADRLPVSGHLEVYEDVHRGLRDTLAALDRPHGPEPRS
jgi:hypothetical protein